ncbi:putative baseplate assembly protein [Streptomyces spinoverrucosus]|uniref:Putative baseplate assembly protein n=1 Tax=Streptomyces spinoverrucosus TaxID=284043 RepID=A0A4Y3VUZ9_9ACTN|nr:putative baseplate assembly protein [Streptomyces spinoverrucosus]GEC09581.1 putative baseplate assembly protein [Streptomyces spinoverrucosus]GHB96085.1 putative baseplate assembly protein [Streptomyces spinoverrucosus]
MALPAPNLDDRRFQDLVDDAKRMVMRRCPEWTDHNVSDPGVTLIETFAFMTDQLLYRLNRVPDRLYVKFLDLIGVTLLPPTAARVPVTFWLSAPATAPLTLPAGTGAATLRTEAEPSVEFSTIDDLHLLPCTLEQLLTLDTDTGHLQPRDEHLRLGVEFPAFGETTPRPGDALLVGLSTPAPRCMISLDFDCHIRGLGVDPDQPPLAWEAWDGTTWTPCELHKDTTGGLNRPGCVVLQIPHRHEASIVDGRRAGWLRARVTDPADGRPRYSTSPFITALSAAVIGGTVDAIHATLVEADEVGTSEGVPNQTFPISRTPVITNEAEPQLHTSSDHGWQEWQRVETFADSGPDDRHWVLDPITGTVRFGPAVRERDGLLRQYGMVPPRDTVIRLTRYATGGGRKGNVGPGAIQTLKSSVPFVARVENLKAAHGGVDGETIDEVKDRGPLLLRTRGRAVTAEDFEALTKQAAPEVARVRCLSAGEADVPPAGVKVLIVPAAGASEGRLCFEDLLPAEETLTRIAARLDACRLIGTRVLIEPPLYRGVTVVVRLTAATGADAARVTDDALTALYGYLNPLTGGPDGTGWPFGRPVRSGDLYAVLQQTPGVDLVEEVRIFAANPVTGERGEQTDRLELEPHSLVFSYEHQIQVDQR